MIFFFTLLKGRILTSWKKTWKITAVVPKVCSSACVFQSWFLPDKFGEEKLFFFLIIIFAEVTDPYNVVFMNYSLMDHCQTFGDHRKTTVHIQRKGVKTDQLLMVSFEARWFCALYLTAWKLVLNWYSFNTGLSKFVSSGKGRSAPQEEVRKFPVRHITWLKFHDCITNQKKCLCSVA